MTPTNEQIRAAIADQASEWFVENRFGPLDREASIRFRAWLRTSPVHIEQYLAAAALAQDLEVAAKASQIALEPLLARAKADRSTVVPWVAAEVVSGVLARRWLLGSLATAAALILVTAAVLWWTRDGERFGLAKTYVTARGEQRERRLPDGSVLHLNTDSQVTVRYSRHERTVDLDRGEAFFQVAHDSKRGFRVAAGDAQVWDVATQFDVYRRPDRVSVTVLEGSVAVYKGPLPLSATRPPPPAAVRVDAGYRVDVTGRVGSPQPAESRASVAWLQRQIVFADHPLGEVVDEFNRYGHVTIEIEEEALRSVPITGVFDAYDTDSFVTFLATLDNVVVKRTPTRILVRSRTSHTPEPRPEAR
jgi:transmembrane sensor